MNANEFLDKEKTTYGNLYSQLVFVLDDIEALSEDSTLRERAYYKNIKILKKYNDLLDEESRKLPEKKSFFSFLSKSKDNEIIKECEDFKKTYKDALAKTFICSECVCVKCIRACEFNPCVSCNKTGKVNYCDKKNTNIIVFKNFIKQQYNSDTKENEPLEILCEVEMLDIDKRFRIIKEVISGQQYVLDYTYDIKDGDLYNSIDDVDLFNEIIEIYENNKF
ncbi:hypothetical protein [Clostridium sp. B9]|uniref:hypothetical protein n=1 Tax=Clostridium sp. B9 TaxID=3423224 RepID=UPI003D2F3487